MTKELDPNAVRTSLTEQITTELRRRILNGQLAEGTTLRQERLATELGVSRIPLREALLKKSELYIVKICNILT